MSKKTFLSSKIVARSFHHFFAEILTGIEDFDFEIEINNILECLHFKKRNNLYHFYFRSK